MDQNGGRNLRFGRTNPIFLSEIKGSGLPYPTLTISWPFNLLSICLISYASILLRKRTVLPKM